MLLLLSYFSTIQYLILPRRELIETVAVFYMCRVVVRDRVLEVLIVTRTVNIVVPVLLAATIEMMVTIELAAAPNSLREVNKANSCNEFNVVCLRHGEIGESVDSEKHQIPRWL